MASLLTWSVHRVQKELSAKTITAAEIFEKHLARSKNVEKLNAFVGLTPDVGRCAAEAVDKARDIRQFPLAGVTIAVKDNFCVRGVRTTCGSRMLGSFVPSYSATVVDRLINAGAMMVGKTNLDEFGMGSGCVDSIHGATKNAWDSNCVSGGSSGGSAVAVASGAATAALGSDTGGSTRNPASYNGVIGLKPTYGVLSRAGLIPLVNSMDVPGVLARRVDDVASLFNVMSGWDNKDSTTVRKIVKVDVTEEANVRGLCVGIPVEYFTEEISDEVAQTWRKVAAQFAEAGATVKEVKLPHTAHSIAVYSVLNQCEVASNMARYTGQAFGFRGDSNDSTEQLYAQSRALGLGDVVRRRILCGNYFLLSKNYSSYFKKAMQVRRLIFEDFLNVWRSGIDVLLTPVTLSDAPLSKDFLSRDARTQSATQDYCTQPTNMAGVPAVSIPISLSSRGLPLSLQLVAPHYEENRLLKTAKFLESVNGFQNLMCLKQY